MFTVVRHEFTASGEEKYIESFQCTCVTANYQKFVITIIYILHEHSKNFSSLILLTLFYNQNFLWTSSKSIFLALRTPLLVNNYSADSIYSNQQENEFVLILKYRYNWVLYNIKW